MWRKMKKRKEKEYGRKNIQPTASTLLCSTDAITDRVKKKKEKDMGNIFSWNFRQRTPLRCYTLEKFKHHFNRQHHQLQKKNIRGKKKRKTTKGNFHVFFSYIYAELQLETHTLELHVSAIFLFTIKEQWGGPHIPTTCTLNYNPNNVQKKKESCKGVLLIVSY